MRCAIAVKVGEIAKTTRTSVEVPDAFLMRRAMMSFGALVPHRVWRQWCAPRQIEITPNNTVKKGSVQIRFDKFLFI
jgi:hypothetical protein